MQYDAVIVIFGAAVRPGGRPSATLLWRVDAAQALAGRFQAPLFLPTGGVGRHGPSEASVMATQLRAGGVPSDRIVLEETGTDTLSSAQAVAALLHAHDDGPVYAVSSPYHLPRCVLLLRLLGVPARAGRVRGFAGLPWWQQIYWWLRELPALPYDAVLAWMARRG